MPPYILVEDAAAWAACLEHVSGEARVAMDLEANSLFAYREQVCLIQISVPDADYIVDPLADFSLDGLVDLLGDPNVEKILHASEYDLILFKREYGATVNNLFDTMWAARLLGYNNMGLAWFLKEYYGVTLSKKYQKTNWARRPLTPEQLNYAQMDTHYLMRLRDDLEAKLEEADLMAEAREIFARECEISAPGRAFDPDAFWNLRGARDLDKRALAILRSLYLFREDVARQRDVPPFKVLTNDALIALANAAPENGKALAGIKGVSPRIVQRIGPGLHKAIAEGRRAPIPKPPKRRPRMDPEVLDRYERLLQWRKERAHERGVESDVILRRDTMWRIAVENPQSVEELGEIPQVGPERLRVYGQHLLEAMNG